MADFEYVDFTRRTPATTTVMTQLSENDQYLYDAVTAMPQGVLGWAKKTTSRNMVNKDVGPEEYYEMASFDVTATVGENRLIKATYKCRGVSGGNANGIRTVAARIRIDDTTTFGAVRFQVEQNYTRGFDPIFHIGTMSPGAHTFTVEHAVLAGKAPDGLAPSVTFEASASSPHQLVIEDIGVYVDNE